MNSITITGNLGKDAELRALGDGTPVANFSVADGQGSDKRSIWWNCVLYGKRAQSLQPYLVKGQQVTIIGSASEREWTDKDGQKRKSMDVRVNDIALQGGKQSAPAQRPAAPASKPSSGFDDMESEIPW